MYRFLCVRIVYRLFILFMNRSDRSQQNFNYKKKMIYIYYISLTLKITYLHGFCCPNCLGMCELNSGKSCIQPWVCFCLPAPICAHGWGHRHRIRNVSWNYGKTNDLYFLASALLCLIVFYSEYITSAASSLNSDCTSQNCHS